MPTFRGKPACSCLITWLPVFEAELLRRGVIKRSIDVAQLIGGAKASGGTHSTGGAFDVWQRDAVTIKVAREMGAATWARTRAQGFDPHAHGVLNGCPHNKPARYQIAALLLGRNGLGWKGLKGRDDGPAPRKLRTWQQGIAWAKALQPKPIPAPVPTVYYVIEDRAHGYAATKGRSATILGSVGFGGKVTIHETAVVFGTRWGASHRPEGLVWWILRDFSKTKPAPKPVARTRYMTYNIADKLNGSPIDVAAYILAGSPHIVGIQEGSGRLAPGVPSVRTAAICQNLGPTWRVLVPTTALNENYFLYDTARVSLHEQLPDLILATPGAVGKHCSRAIFKDNATGDLLPVSNVHLEHQRGVKWDAVREAQAAKAVADDIGGVILGDLNTPLTLKALTDKGYSNVRDGVAKVQGGQYATHSGTSLTPSLDATHNYDHIYAKAVHVNGVRVVTILEGGKYRAPKASDHQPVVADLSKETP